jgi:hypothetical protein
MAKQEVEAEFMGSEENGTYLRGFWHKTPVILAQSKDRVTGMVTI